MAAKEYQFCLDLLKEFIGVCATIGFLLIICACNLLCSTKVFRRLLVRFPVCLRIRDVCEYLSCSWTLCGKLLSTLWSIFSVASFGFFIAHTALHPKQIVFKKKRTDWILVYADLGLNAYFIVFFIVRFIGTTDKWAFMVSSSTWMEVLTVGPALTAVFGDKKQLMFSFLRALRLAGLKDLLFVIGIVRRCQLKTLTNILVNIICFWCVFAGIIYQTENLDDYSRFTKWKLCPIHNNEPEGKISFFHSMYFLLVTASSVGYGDITPSNVTTRVAIIIFVAIAVTFFASAIPDLYALCSVPQNFGNHSFYTGAGERHIIYCGSSQLNRLKSFFWNFYHNRANSPDRILRVCMLQSRQISENITWFLRSFCGRITVVFGSPSDAECLIDSCQLRLSDAVIITSEAGMRSDFEADRLNYVRTIGLKLCAPNCRTIVQIKSMFHKQSFRALPLWRTRHGKPGSLPPDAVLCDNQVLLGLMGVNSVAPGFATLLINLLSYRQSQSGNKDANGESRGFVGIGGGGRGGGCSSTNWRTAYSAGIQAKLYCVSFTAQHRDRSFKTVALEAYQAGGVLLVGVCMVDKLTGILTGVINPAFDAGFTINPSTMKAFLISRDAESAAKFESCPSVGGLRGVFVHTGGGGDRRTFVTPRGPQLAFEDSDTAKTGGTEDSIAVGVSYDLTDELAFWQDGRQDATTTAVLQRRRQRPQQQHARQPGTVDDDEDDEDESDNVDGGGSAAGGQQEEHRLEEWYRENVDRRCEGSTQRELHAAEHAIPPLEDVTGTLHWAPNRRCRRLSISEAKSIEFSNHIVVVVIGTLEHPLGLSSLVLPLRNKSIPVEQLSDIVILGDADSIEEHEWRGIRNFPFIYVVDGSGVHPQHLLYCRAHKATAMTVLNLVERCDASFGDPFLADKMTLLCTENLRGLGARDCHVTSELFFSPNAYCFSDPAERLADISANDVMDTQSFAEGLVVSSPNLTGLLASVYFCPESLAFLESVIYGSNQPSVDDYLSLDFCIPSCLSRSHLSADQSRVFGFRLLQLGATEPPLRDLFQMFDCKEMKWEDLLIGCLDKFDIMCLGVYRRRTIRKMGSSGAETTSGWFVLTFPDPGTQIDQNDRIFCFATSSNRYQRSQ